MNETIENLKRLIDRTDEETVRKAMKDLVDALDEDSIFVCDNEYDYVEQILYDATIQLRVGDERKQLT